ncbi:hypothetical protein R0J90_06545 [Micrococcus sp. SIMBA_144]
MTPDDDAPVRLIARSDAPGRPRSTVDVHCALELELASGRRVPLLTDRGWTSRAAAARLPRRRRDTGTRWQRSRPRPGCRWVPQRCASCRWWGRPRPSWPPSWTGRTARPAP